MTTLHENIEQKRARLVGQIKDLSNSAFCAVASLQHAVEHCPNDISGQRWRAHEAAEACARVGVLLARLDELDTLQYTIDGARVEDYPPKP